MHLPKIAERLLIKILNIGSVTASKVELLLGTCDWPSWHLPYSATLIFLTDYF